MKCMKIAEDKGKLLTSQQIHDYISTNTLYFESTDLDKYGKPLFFGDYTYDNLPGVRSALTYLRSVGYVTKDNSGIPALFGLSKEGRLLAKDAFYGSNC